MFKRSIRNSIVLSLGAILVLSTGTALASSHHHRSKPSPIPSPSSKPSPAPTPAPAPPAPAPSLIPSPSPSPTSSTGTSTSAFNYSCMDQLKRTSTMQMSNDGKTLNSSYFGSLAQSSVKFPDAIYVFSNPWIFPIYYNVYFASSNFAPATGFGAPSVLITAGIDLLNCTLQGAAAPTLPPPAASFVLNPNSRPVATGAAPSLIYGANNTVTVYANEPFSVIPENGGEKPAYCTLPAARNGVSAIGAVSYGVGLSHTGPVSTVLGGISFDSSSQFDAIGANSTVKCELGQLGGVFYAPGTEVLSFMAFGTDGLSQSVSVTFNILPDQTQSMQYISGFNAGLTSLHSFWGDVTAVNDASGALPQCSVGNPCQGMSLTTGVAGSFPIEVSLTSALSQTLLSGLQFVSNSGKDFVQAPSSIAVRILDQNGKVIPIRAAWGTGSTSYMNALSLTQYGAFIIETQTGYDFTVSGTTYSWTLQVVDNQSTGTVVVQSIPFSLTLL